MSNSPNIDNEKAKTTEDPKTHSSAQKKESGFVEFERSDLPPERIERLGQYLSHSTKNSSNVDERNTTAYGNTETSTLDIPHQSGKSRADYPVTSPEVPSNEAETFVGDTSEQARKYFTELGKDYETFPRSVIESVIPEEDKVASPNLTYGNGHQLLPNNAKKVTDELIDTGANTIMRNSRWAGVGQKRFPQDSPIGTLPNVYARTNRFEPKHISEHKEYEHPTGQNMSDVAARNLDKFWPEYQRRVGKFGPAMQQAATNSQNVSAMDAENLYENFEEVDDNIQLNEIPSLTDKTYGQPYNSENQFESTEYVHQVPENKTKMKIPIPLPDITGPLNHPSIRTAETRMNGSLRSRLALGNVPSLMLNPPNAAQISKRMEDAGLGKNSYGSMEAYNGTLWVSTPGDIKRKDLKAKVGKRYQERPDGRFTPEQVRLMEDMLEAEHMPFYIQDLRTNEVIGFHAFLNSISDSYTGEWSAQKGFGRLEAAQIYGGGSRSIGCSFTMVAMNPADFDEMYVKINKLTTLVYPQWSRGTLMQQGENRFVQPFSQVPTASPLCRIRVGDLFTSNYSKKAMARMMGIEDPNFVYEGMDTAPAEEPQVDDSPSTVRDKLKDAIEEKKEEAKEKIDEFGWYLKIHFWSVIQKFLFEQGFPAQFMPKLQQWFEANHKSFTPSVKTFILPNPAGNLPQIPSETLVGKSEELISKMKGKTNDKIDRMIDKGEKALKDELASVSGGLGAIGGKVKEIGAKYIGSEREKLGGFKDQQMKAGEEQVRGNEYVTEAFKQATEIDKQIDKVREFQTTIPEGPVEVHQVMINFPFPPGVPKFGIPTQIPYHTPSVDRNEIVNFIAECGKFDKDPPPPSPPPAEADGAGVAPGEPQPIAFEAAAKKPPKQIIDLFDSNKNPIFKSFESSMGRGIAVAINSIGLEWKLGSAPWNMEVGARAPRMCEITLGLIPIHDITPGLDHNGINRAPIYKVGSSRDLTGDVWYNDEEFKEMQKNIKRDTLVALVPWGEIVKGVIE